MVAEFLEADELRAEVGDPIGAALPPLIEAIFGVTRDGSSERAAALSELMASVERIRLALRPKPSFH